jgi:hypothetical protein
MFELLYYFCFFIFWGYTSKVKDLANNRQYKHTDFIGKFWIILKYNTEQTSLRVKNETYILSSALRRS